MTAGNAGKGTIGIKGMLIAGVSLLTACGGTGPLQSAWQQDPNLYHRGFPARPSQSATTPHFVTRIVYAAPDEIVRLVERQGDVPDTHRGFARVGDGALDLAVQDVATGKWIESHLCGGILFVGGLPNQAYRIVLKNRTPMPLQLGVGVDGKNIENGAAATLARGGLRIEPRGTLTLDHGARGPLLFKKVRGESALFDTSPEGRTGLVQVAVFLAADAPSVGPEKLRASQIAPLGLLPLGAPEQYR